jgi:hypothetical protein
VAESGKNEDLFIFPVKHITLKKGQRMVMPIGEFTMKYKDVFTLDIPFAPPPETWRNFDGGRQAELARLFSSPKVMHKIRLYNSSEYPLTTAPALILKNDRVLAQGMMTYASPGSDTDLSITTAIDIRVKKAESARPMRRTGRATSTGASTLPARSRSRASARNRWKWKSSATCSGTWIQPMPAARPKW